MVDDVADAVAAGAALLLLVLAVTLGDDGSPDIVSVDVQPRLTLAVVQAAHQQMCLLQLFPMALAARPSILRLQLLPYVRIR